MKPHIDQEITMKRYALRHLLSDLRSVDVLAEMKIWPPYMFPHAVGRLGIL